MHTSKAGLKGCHGIRSGANGSELKISRGRRGGRRAAALLAMVAAMTCKAIDAPHAAYAQDAPPAGAARQFAAATALQNQEQFDKAADAWDTFLKDHPNDPRADRAWHHLGVCRLKNNEYAAAQTAFERLIADHPKSTLAGSAWLNLGLAQYDRAAAGEADFYGKAAETFATLLEKFPRAAEAPRAAFYRAEALYAQGKNADAAKLYADFIKKYPQNPLLADALYAQGVALQEIGSHAAAGASYDAWLKQFADRPPAAEVIFRRGETLLAEGKAASAEKWFASAAARPEFELVDLALLRQAACREELREHLRAADLYSSLPQKFPMSKHREAALLAAARCYEQAGQSAEAAARYQSLLEQFPEGKSAPRATYALGWLQLGQQDYAAAAQTLDDVLAKYPADEFALRAHYARALAREQLKQYALALDDAQAFLSSEPSGEAKSDARYLIGLCQARLERPEDAAATFRDLLADDPKYVAADKTLYELAWALSSLDRSSEAADAWRRLVKQHPDSPLTSDSLYQLAEQAYAQGDYAVAATDYYQAMQKAGKRPLAERAAHRLGLAYFHQQAFEKARQSFAYQRQTFPDGRIAADAAFMEGESLFKLGKYTDALAAYAKADKPTGEDAGVLLLLHSAQAAAKLKQWDKSLGLLEQAAEQFADSSYLPDIRFEQGWAKQNLGSLNAAQRLYEEVTATTDREIAAHARFLIGQMYFEQKQYDEAVKHFVKAAYGYSYPQWQSRAHYEAGRAYEALGQRDDAAKSYREVIDQFPDSGEARPARQRLAALKML